MLVSDPTPHNIHITTRCHPSATACLAHATKMHAWVHLPPARPSTTTAYICWHSCTHVQHCQQHPHRLQPTAYSSWNVQPVGLCRQEQLPSRLALNSPSMQDDALECMFEQQACAHTRHTHNNHQTQFGRPAPVDDPPRHCAPSSPQAVQAIGVQGAPRRHTVHSQPVIIEAISPIITLPIGFQAMLGCAGTTRHQES